jgi:rare lipoprotein A
MLFKLKKRNISLFCRSLAIFGLALLFVQGCSTAVSPRAPTKYTKAPTGHYRSPDQAKHPKPYRVGKKWYQPLPHAENFRQRGIASWYGKKFHGRKTSSGEIYNMYAMTAAHKTLPLGTYVNVRHLNNQREIEVRINDRGPFIRGRVIDLSYTAAKKIGIVGPGTAPVEIIALGKAAAITAPQSVVRSYVPVDYSTGNFTIQVGAFSNRDNARRLQQWLGRKYKNVHVTTFFNGNETLYRVRAGRCSTLEQAEEYERIMIENGFKDAVIVAE